MRKHCSILYFITSDIYLKIVTKISSFLHINILLYTKLPIYDTFLKMISSSLEDDDGEAMEKKFSRWRESGSDRMRDRE